MTSNPSGNNRQSLCVQCKNGKHEPDVGMTWSLN